MMIERHSIDYQFVSEDLERTKESFDILPAISNRPMVLESIVKYATRLFAMSSVLAPASGRLLSLARLAAQANAAIFRLAAHPGEAIRATIGDLGEIGLPWYRPRSRDDVISWLYGQSFAMMAREHDLLRQYAEVPLAVLRASDVEADEYLYLWVAALQSFHRGDGRTRAVLDQARLATTPGKVEISTPAAVKRTEMHMDALEALVAGDEDAFHRNLAGALAAFREYWLRQEHHPLDYRGFVDIESLGLACAAHDAGLAVRVDSGYLPASVIRREFTES